MALLHCCCWVHGELEQALWHRVPAWKETITSGTQDFARLIRLLICHTCK